MNMIFSPSSSCMTFISPTRIYYSSQDVYQSVSSYKFLGSSECVSTSIPQSLTIIYDHDEIIRLIKVMKIRFAQHP